IHAPREGSDPLSRSGLRSPRHFYPRSPRGERRRYDGLPLHGGDFYPRSPRGERPRSRYRTICLRLFLSTLPARGATTRTGTTASALTYFYPRSPRGERPALYPGNGHDGAISIHAPREGSDRCVHSLAVLSDISIHAPREGSDSPWMVMMVSMA